MTENERSIDDRKRIFINIARGVAIFLMLWGHCIQYAGAGQFDFFENGVYKTIYSFHMPLFMLISGYLFFFSCRKRDLKTLLVHRVQAMLQPIIMCSILHFLLTDVYFGLRSGTLPGTDGWFGHLGEYWFLWSVLASSVPVAIAMKGTDKRLFRGVLLCLGIFFAALMPCAEMNIFMYPYFVLGFLYAGWENTPFMEKIKPFRYLSFVLFPILLRFYKTEHYIYTSGIYGEEGLMRHMPVNLFRWAIGLVGCIFALTLLSLIFRWLSEHKKADAVPCGLMAKSGENSLQIYVLSGIFLSRYLPMLMERVYNRIGYEAFVGNRLLYDLVFTPVLAACYAVGLLLILFVLKKIKVSRILFGK